MKNLLALALLGILACASPDGRDAENPAVASSTSNEITRISTEGFSATVERLREAIARRPLKLFAEIDHAAGARSAGLELDPSTLFVFGNPKLGSPFMRADPRMGLELPLRMLVFEEDGVVRLAWTDIVSEVSRRALDGQAGRAAQVAANLEAIAAEAANDVE